PARSPARARARRRHRQPAGVPTAGRPADGRPGEEVRGGASPRSGERGVALLSALLTVALLTVIVIEMTDAPMVNTHLSRNAGTAMAAQLLARSAATLGETLVGSDSTNPDPTCDRNPWAMPYANIPAGAGLVFLQITDE